MKVKWVQEKEGEKFSLQRLPADSSNVKFNFFFQERNKFWSEYKNHLVTNCVEIKSRKEIDETVFRFANDNWRIPINQKGHRHLQPDSLWTVFSIFCTRFCFTLFLVKIILWWGNFVFPRFPEIDFSRFSLFHWNCPQGFFNWWWE